MATIVVLNGTSSSGKTTLARAFQDVAASVFLNFSIDHIFYALPQSALDRIAAGLTIPDLPFLEVHKAFFACVRELAALGRDLVIDNSITSRAQAELLIAAVEGHRVLFVSVSCAPETLARREHTRGDRNAGLAARQLETIDRWLDYDLRIDTSTGSAPEHAQRIVEALAQEPLTAKHRTALARTSTRLLP